MSESRRYPSLGAEYRLRRHRPWRKGAAVALVVIIIGGGSWGLYHAGLRAGGYSARKARATEMRLRTEVSSLHDRIDRFARRNATLERGQKVDAGSKSRLQETLAKREHRITSLKQQLAFYRNLVSPSKTRPGIKIRRLRLHEVAGVERTYRYAAVLTQLNGSGEEVAGHIRLRINGKLDGNSHAFDLDAIQVPDTDPETAFRFKYFQKMKGRIQLPPTFVPARVELRIIPAGGRVSPREKAFGWDSVTNGG